MGIAPLKGHESIFNTFSKEPFRPGREGEREEGNGKRKTENGNLRVSESRSKVYFDYAEREQVQDDAVGLNLQVSEQHGRDTACRVR